MRIKNRKIPCGAFGIQGAANLMNSLGNNASGIAQLVSQFTTDSNATTTGQAVGQSLSDVANGISTGASIGSTFGPVGTIVGSAAGLATGLVGHKGKKAEMTSFTDYDEGTLGTGLIGAFGNGSLRRRRREIKKNAFNNRAAVANTANLQEDYDYMDVDAAAEGGTPLSLAYLDDGEVLQAPDGTLSKIPEQGNPTDSNLELMQAGTRVLSDKLKVPGTKKTFAETMDDYVRVRNTKGTDIYAQNAQKLNDMNSNAMYDRLFNMQEEMKRQKGIKRKYKNLVPTGADGLDDIEYDSTIMPSMIGYDTTGSINNSTITPTADMQAAFNAYNSSALSAAGERVDAANRKAARSANMSKLGDAIQGLGTAAASLTPIISNLSTDRAETYAPAYNPYENIARRLMRRRRVRLDATERALRRQQAIDQYNANQYNTSTGANLAFAAATSSDRRQQLANARLAAESANAQYDAERANTLIDLGRGRVDAYNNARDINMRNRAAARNIRRTGLSQLSQYAQNREYMRNYMNRDNALMQLYAPWLENMYSNDTVGNFYNYLNRRGNNAS